MEWDKPKIKFYKYYFSNNEKPVIMEAYNREEADNMLLLLNEKTQKLDYSCLKDVRIEMPIKGLSKKTRMGITYIWVGIENSQNGWIEETEFQKK